MTKKDKYVEKMQSYYKQYNLLMSESLRTMQAPGNL